MLKINAAWKEFGDLFGRYYNPVESYRTDGAQLILITMGSISETAMTAIDKMREKGLSVGLVRFRLWKPFPAPEFKKAIAGAQILAVVDRALSPGGTCGPVAEEIKAALYAERGRPKVFNFVAGLGGRDVTVEHFEEMVSKAFAYATKRPKQLYDMIGVREI